MPSGRAVVGSIPSRILLFGLEFGPAISVESLARDLHAEIGMRHCTPPPSLLAGLLLLVGAALSWGRDGAPRDGGSVEVFGVDASRASVLIARAEDVRREVTSRFLGINEPVPWDPPCEIHIHPDRDAFRAAVGDGPMIAEGATSIEFVGDQVSLRRIDLLDMGAAVPSALAHELVHVVLADHFTDAPPPRWADEGLATLFDDDEKQRQHEADHAAAAARGQAWAVRDLVSLDLHPADSARQRVFYGQAAALVRWLIARQDGPTFIGFLDLAAEKGIAPALSIVYGIPSVDALERAWRSTPVPLH